MELKFETKHCRCMRKIARQVRDVEQTQEIRLTEQLPDAGKVLCAWGQALLRSKQWRGQDMTAAGGVMVWVLFAPEDGSSPRWLEGWIPFQAKWDLPDTEREGVMRIQPMLRSVDARMISARKLMVRVSVSIWAEALESWEAEVFTAEDVEEDIQILRNTYPVMLMKEAGEKAFDLDEELDVPSPVIQGQQIVRCSLIPQILESKVMAGKLVFRGKCLVHVLLADPDGQFFGTDLEFQFSQFGDLEEEFSQDAAADLVTAATALETELQEDGKLRVRCSLVVQYCVADRVMLELAEDAYSCCRDTALSYQDLALPVILEERNEAAAAELTVELDRCKAVDLAFLQEQPKLRTDADSVVCDLGGVFQLLYEDEAGELRCALRYWEQTRTFSAAEGSGIQVRISQEGQPSAVFSVAGMELIAPQTLFRRTEAEQGQPMLKSIELGEKRQPDPNRPSVVLRRAGEGRLWDLAKDYGTTVSAICQANQLCSDPEPGQMLLIPVL